MATEKFSQISPAGRNLGSTDRLVGYDTTGPFDYYYTLDEIVAGVGGRVRLLANATYYWSNAGSDTAGDGTSGNPYLTQIKCWNVICSTLDINGMVVTILPTAGGMTATDNIVIGGDGNQSPTTASVPFGGGTIVFGDTTQAVPYIWNPGAKSCFFSSVPVNSLLKFTNIHSTNTTGTGLYPHFKFTAQSVALFQGMNFGAADFGWVQALGPCVVNFDYTQAYTLSGSPFVCGFEAASGASIVFQNIGATGCVLNATAALTYSFMMLTAYGGGFQGFDFSFTTSGAGSYAGQRWLATKLGYIETFGAGAAAFPGTVAGDPAPGVLGTSGGVMN